MIAWDTGGGVRKWGSHSEGVSGRIKMLSMEEVQSELVLCVSVLYYC